MARKKVTQTSLILNHLTKGKSITSWEAIKKYGCTRLSAKILELRKQGYDIKAERVVSKNRYGYNTSFARYTLY